jgi:SAM-dependent methyltransferase
MVQAGQSRYHPPLEEVDMAREEVSAIFDWVSNQLTIEGRAEFVEEIGPHLASLIRQNDHVLDVGCGTGVVAFFFEECGARVTGIDLTPALLALARDEAAARGSTVEFIEGDVLADDLGEEMYELVVCLGNVILDFPHRTFPGFRDRVCRALKPGGRLAIQHLDGVLRFRAMSSRPEVVEQGAAGKIMRRFEEYDPVQGAYRMRYRHLESGESLVYTGYVYTGPLIRIVMETVFDLERSIRFGESSFLDIYRKR